MRRAVYGAVLVIALGSALLGLDWLRRRCLRWLTPRRASAPPAAIQSSPATPSANIGAPIVPPSLAAPASPIAPATGGAAARAGVAIAAPEPEVRCNIDACAAAYRSFRTSDCTYQPTNGPRRLCTK